MKCLILIAITLVASAKGDGKCGSADYITYQTQTCTPMINSYYSIATALAIAGGYCTASLSKTAINSQALIFNNLAGTATYHVGQCALCFNAMSLPAFYSGPTDFDYHVTFSIQSAINMCNSSLRLYCPNEVDNLRALIPQLQAAADDIRRTHQANGANINSLITCLNQSQVQAFKTAYNNTQQAMVTISRSFSAKSGECGFWAFANSLDFYSASGSNADTQAITANIKYQCGVQAVNLTAYAQPSIVNTVVSFATTTQSSQAYCISTYGADQVALGSFVPTAALSLSTSEYNDFLSFEYPLYLLFGSDFVQFNIMFNDIQTDFNVQELGIPNVANSGTCQGGITGWGVYGSCLIQSIFSTYWMTQGAALCGAVATQQIWMQVNASITAETVCLQKTSDEYKQRTDDIKQSMKWCVDNTTSKAGDCAKHKYSSKEVNQRNCDVRKTLFKLSYRFII